MREAVHALHQEGCSRLEIAKKLGVSKGTVGYHIRRLDIAIDKRFGVRYDWQEIQRAYDSGLSVRACAARFGFNLASWHQAVRRGAVKARPARVPIEELLVSDRPQTNRTHLKERLIEEGFLDNRCARCGITHWRGERLSLQLHHINGDGTDNRLENLELLCPNDHSLTPTWGGRNGHRKPRRARPRGAGAVREGAVSEQDRGN